MMRLKQMVMVGMLGVLAACGTMSSAKAEPLVFYTGAEGGGYHKKSVDLVNRMKQRGVDVVLQNRNGSDDITLQACQNPNSAWIAQHDAVWKREMEGCTLMDVGVYGIEYAFLLFPPKSDLGKLRDLTASHTVLVDKVGSGSELTWDTMVKIEKDYDPDSSWLKASKDNSEIKLAVSRAARSEIDAVFMVRSQNSDDIKRLVKSGWTVGEMWAEGVEEYQWGNNAMYPSHKLAFMVEGKKLNAWVFDVTTLIGTTYDVSQDNKVYGELVNIANP